MAWFRFARAFDFNPVAQPAVTIAYPVGEFSVTRECVTKALAAEAGEKIPTPVRLIDASA